MLAVSSVSATSMTVKDLRADVMSSDTRQGTSANSDVKADAHGSNLSNLEATAVQGNGHGTQNGALYTPSETLGSTESGKCDESREREVEAHEQVKVVGSTQLENNTTNGQHAQGRDGESQQGPAVVPEKSGKTSAQVHATEQGVPAATGSLSGPLQLQQSKEEAVNTSDTRGPNPSAPSVSQASGGTGLQGAQSSGPSQRSGHPTQNPPQYASATQYSGGTHYSSEQVPGSAPLNTQQHHAPSHPHLHGSTGATPQFQSHQHQLPSQQQPVSQQHVYPHGAPTQHQVQGPVSYSHQGQLVHMQPQQQQGQSYPQGGPHHQQGHPHTQQQLVLQSPEPQMVMVAQQGQPGPMTPVQQHMGPQQGTMQPQMHYQQTPGQGGQQSYQQMGTSYMVAAPGSTASSPKAVIMQQPTMGMVSPGFAPGDFGSWAPFTTAQWHELEQQAMVFKYLVAGAPVPQELVESMRMSLANSAAGHHGHIMHFGQAMWGAQIDPEPFRCRRTDGKKWRCSREVVPEQKYCERHMHRGRNRARKVTDKSTPGSSLVTEDQPEMQKSASQGGSEAAAEEQAQGKLDRSESVVGVSSGVPPPLSLPPAAQPVAAASQQQSAQPPQSQSQQHPPHHQRQPQLSSGYSSQQLPHPPVQQGMMQPPQQGPQPMQPHLPAPTQHAPVQYQSQNSISSGGANNYQQQQPQTQYGQYQPAPPNQPGSYSSQPQSALGDRNQQWPRPSSGPVTYPNNAVYSSAHVTHGYSQQQGPPPYNQGYSQQQPQQHEPYGLQSAQQQQQNYPRPQSSYAPQPSSSGLQPGQYQLGQNGQRNAGMPPPSYLPDQGNSMQQHGPPSMTFSGQSSQGYSQGGYSQQQSGQYGPSYGSQQQQQQQQQQQPQQYQQQPAPYQQQNTYGHPQSQSLVRSESQYSSQSSYGAGSDAPKGHQQHHYSLGQAHSQQQYQGSGYQPQYGNNAQSHGQNHGQDFSMPPPQPQSAPTGHSPPGAQDSKVPLLRVPSLLPVSGSSGGPSPPSGPPLVRTPSQPYGPSPPQHTSGASSQISLIAHQQQQQPPQQQAPNMMHHYGGDHSAREAPGNIRWSESSAARAGPSPLKMRPGDRAPAGPFEAPAQWGPPNGSTDNSGGSHGPSGLVAYHATAPSQFHHTYGGKVESTMGPMRKPMDAHAGVDQSVDGNGSSAISPNCVLQRQHCLSDTSSTESPLGPLSITDTGLPVPAGYSTVSGETTVETAP